MLISKCFLPVLCMLLVSGCIAANSTDLAKEEELVNYEGPAMKDIVDSIHYKASLSTEQVKRYFSIDSIYFSDKCTFSGEKIYTLNDKLQVAIINYEDGLSCFNRFLAVADNQTKQPLALRIVETNCDADGDEDQNGLNYHFINDSTFVTEEGDGAKATWSIHSNGKIKEVKGK